MNNDRQNSISTHPHSLATVPGVSGLGIGRTLPSGTLLSLFVLAALSFGCGHDPSGPTAVAVQGNTKLKVTCAAFAEGKPIAARHSAYLDNLSPSLSWSKGPAGTKSYAILVEDPDAPVAEPFLHWLTINISPDLLQIPEGIRDEPKPSVLQGGLQGTNGTGKIGFFGPKPDVGPQVHHYHFRVFAIDSLLKLSPGFTKQEFLSESNGHVLAEGETVGTYEKPKT
ncbi:hypothetical protein BH11ARM1_BH11ARM1_14530 [soil metagenome]